MNDAESFCRADSGEKYDEHRCRIGPRDHSCQLPVPVQSQPFVHISARTASCAGHARRRRRRHHDYGRLRFRAGTGSLLSFKASQSSLRQEATACFCARHRVRRKCSNAPSLSPEGHDSSPFGVYIMINDEYRVDEHVAGLFAPKAHEVVPITAGRVDGRRSESLRSPQGEQCRFVDSACQPRTIFQSRKSKYHKACSSR